MRVCDCFPQLKETTLAREARSLADRSRPAPEGPQPTVHVEVASVGTSHSIQEAAWLG